MKKGHTIGAGLLTVDPILGTTGIGTNLVLIVCDVYF